MSACIYPLPVLVGRGSRIGVTRNGISSLYLPRPALPAPLLVLLNLLNFCRFSQTVCRLDGCQLTAGCPAAASDAAAGPVAVLYKKQHKNIRVA